AKKERIRSTRVKPTRALCESMAQAAQPPKVLICASAIGYYGDRGSEWLDEDSPAGSGFLPEVCQAWEDACSPARDAGIRVIHVRFGIVLAKQGGALQSMLLPFRLGFGGRVGSGDQYWSWVALEDVVGAIQHGLHQGQLSGPINVTAPHPVTNRDFTTALGQVMHRPTLIPLPAFGARLALGSEMADSLLLASARVRPARLLESGYEFRFPELGPCLESILA
ncbi:MAG TPA: TIGR01777 family oxidoreductase, partial [Planctomycetota bacterium]|nr:TIGR01777 family oxidoreductase [Planctomycetota bacterium]